MIRLGPLQERNRAIEQPDSANHEDQPAEKPSPDRTTFPEEPVCWHPEEKEHRRKERQFWRASIGLSFVALLIAGTSFVFAYRAWIAGEEQARAAMEQADVAQKAFVASHRPWVKMVSVKPVSVSISGAGAIIAVDLKVENIGISPAENVYAAGKAFAETSLSGERRTAESFCKQKLVPQLKFLRTVVFPGEKTRIHEGTFTINRRDVEKARTDYANSQSRILRKKIMTNPLYGFFTVVGCITYKISGSKKRGETAFSFDVDKRVPGYPKLEGGFAMDKPANYGAADVFLILNTWDLFAQ